MWIEAHCFFKLGHEGAPGRHAAASPPRGAGSGLGSLAGDEETRPSVPRGMGRGGAAHDRSGEWVCGPARDSRLVGKASLFAKHLGFAASGPAPSPGRGPALVG